MDLNEFIAWVLDFEGSITIAIHRGRNGKIQYEPKVSIMTTSKEHLHQFQQRIGIGTACPTPHYRTNSNYSPSFAWRLSVKEIKEHLPKIRPFLFLKQEQADCAIRLCEIKKPNHSRMNEYTADEQYEMTYLYNRCIALNAKVPEERTESDRFFLQLLKYSRK